MVKKVNTNNYTRLISFNVRGIQIGGDRFATRMAQLYEYASDNSIDEIHLQEVYTYNMLHELKKHLPQFPYVIYQKSVWGPKAGLMSLYKAQPKISYFHSLSGSRPARADLFWVVPYIHKGVLVTQLPNGRVRFNLHLQADHTGRWKPSSREFQLILLQLNEVKGIVSSEVQKKPASSFVVVGDFNLPTTTTAYSDFVNKLGVKDVFGSDPKPTYNANFLPPGKSAHQIDHILVWSEKKVDIKDSKYVFVSPVNGVYASDHAALVATLVT